MLRTVTINGFRAHRDTTLTLEPLTAIVGPNGAGKSALLRAIDLVLGERWPSLASLRLPQDFTDFDATQEMRIQLSFSEPLLCEADAAGDQAQIHHFRVTCRPYKNTGRWGHAGDPNFDFEALDALEEKPMQCANVTQGGKRNYRPLLGVSGSLRAQIPALLISHQRSVAQQMPWTRGSVLVKLLEPARRELDDPVDVDGEPQARRVVFNERFAQAMEVLRSPHVRSSRQRSTTRRRGRLGFLAAPGPRICRSALASRIRRIP